MNKKVFLLSFISMTIIASAENYQKTAIESQLPTIYQNSHSLENQLVLSVGVFDPVNEVLTFNKSKISAIESSKYSIIQFHVGKADSEWLYKNGIKVVSYLPNNAFVVVANNRLSEFVFQNKNIRWHGKYLSTYKVKPTLWPKNLKTKSNVDLMVAVFNDFPKENLEKLFRKYLPQLKIKRIFKGTTEVILSLNNDNINDVLNTLSQIDAVQYIEEAKPEIFHNTEAVSAVQANVDPDGSTLDNNYVPSVTPIWDKGLFGTGQIIGITDSGLDSNEDWFVHYDNGQTITHEVTIGENTNPPTLGNIFPNRKVIGHFVLPGASAGDESGHGTHTTGSMAADRLESIGSGPAGSISSPTHSGYDNDDGMAPNAQILFQDTGTETLIDGENEAILVGRDSSAMWQQAYNAGVRIHSNSYGTLDGDGSYTFSDIQTDRTLHELEDLLILFSAGNDGAAENTITSPATAKNVLTVGALSHGNSNFIAGFSSRGPTDDGRLKPDIMATGSRIESARSDSNTNSTIENPLRSLMSGTSMSTPITAGSAALMRQYYIDGFYPTGSANPADAHIPTGPLMKATLINGAGIDTGHFDNAIGWGRVFLSNSILFDDNDKQLRMWEVTNPNGIKTGESIEFKLEIKSGQNLAITLVWYDLPGSFGSTKTLINDLDLTVEINNQLYKGNIFRLAGQSDTGGIKDSLNTVEQVRFKTPEEGLYTITVTGGNIPGDGTLNAIRQGFALVATGDFDNISTSPAALTDVTNLAAIMQNDNGVELTWLGGDNADYFEVYRAIGTCATADFKMLRFVGNSENGSYTDFRTLNGITYAYKIRAGQYQELGGLSTSCAEVTSAQACDFIPTFNQNSIVVSNNIGDLCHNKLQWSSGTSNCPSTPNIKYNIYRSGEKDFTPSSSNLLTTVTTTSFDDIRAPDTAAYYIIRAEDDGGTESLGNLQVRSQAIGTGTTSGPVFEDVDNTAIMNLSPPWQVASAKSADGILSYKTGSDNEHYPDRTCSSIVTNTMSITSSLTNPTLDYKTLYSLEENWDGVVVEVSTDNGNTWSDLPPNSGYPSDFSSSDDNNGGVNNECGYAKTQAAFSGTNNDGIDTFQTVTHDLSPFVGQDIKVRWRLSSDSTVSEEGFYLDSIQYPNIESPNACTVNTALDKPQAGLYFDRGRSGHGFVVEPIANTDLYFTVFYTYKDDGTPEWYTSLSTLENNVLNMNLEGETLLRFTHDFTVDPTGAGNPNTIDTTIGTNVLKIDFNSENVASSNACNDGVANRKTDSVALATWQLGNQQGDWCIEPLIAQDKYPSPDFGGTWWTGIDDDGWGLSLSFSGDLIVVTIYYFDANGQPRWAQGLKSGFQVGQQISVDMTQFNGYARDATPIELITSNAGAIVLTLNSNTGNGNDGSLTVNVNYTGSEGGTWTRTDVPLTIFTEPH